MQGEQRPVLPRCRPFALIFDGVRGFTFDSANRLTGAGSSTLAYDPLDRLREMVGTLGARYLYDGDEIAGVVASPTGTTLNARFVRGPWPDELILAYQGTGTGVTNYSLQDHQNSVIAIADGTGAATATLGYDEYGQPRSGNAGRLMYTGQLWLPDFGLYHYKARAYHPGLGRFVQTDPVGYEQGMNLYAYVGLDPMNRMDPDGLYRRGTGFTDPEWRKFNRAQQRQARRMERQASRLERQAAKMDKKAPGSGDVKRLAANNLRAGASELRNTGPDAAAANIFTEAEYAALGRPAGSQAHTPRGGNYSNFTRGDLGVFGENGLGAEWTIGHESLHLRGAALEDPYGPNGAKAYVGGSQNNTDALDAIRGTPLAAINPDSLLRGDI